MSWFAIDDQSVDLNGLDVEKARSTFRAFIEQIVETAVDGHEICYDDELFHRDIRRGDTFWQLFASGSDLHLDHDDIEKAAALFGTMTKWYELESLQPLDFDIRVDEGPVETSGSIAWVHAQGESGLSSAACLSAQNARFPGRHQVTVAGVTRGIWFVTCSADSERYFRDLLSAHAEVPADFAALARYAFRDLLFVEDCFDGIRKMARPCRALAPSLVAHLSVFSDVGRHIFAGRWQEAPAKFGSLGVDISDENGGTKQDRKAAAERRRAFEGKEYYFWWHSKIEPHRDRIHICPDQVPSGGKIIIGIFCFHLK